MNKFKIMEEINKMEITDKQEISSWLTDSIMKQHDKELDESFDKLTKVTRK